MNNPFPVNLQTSTEVRQQGWQAESRDADGHLISCHAPIEADDQGIAEWIVECTSRGETVTFWPTTDKVATTQPPPPSTHVDVDTAAAIALGASVLTRIEDPAAREIAIRNALMTAAQTSPPETNVATCQHEEWVTGYDHCQCKQCGSIKTDGGWGIASRTWFKSRDEAVFFQKNGRLPDPSPVQHVAPDIDGGRFEEWSLTDFAAQCRMQSREQLDPEFSRFMAALAKRLSELEPTPEKHALAADLVERAFEIGFCWRSQLMLQNVEDSRAVGRTLQSYIFDGIDIETRDYPSFETGDHGIVEAKKRIIKALRALASPSPQPNLQAENDRLRAIALDLQAAYVEATERAEEAVKAANALQVEVDRLRAALATPEGSTYE